MLLQFGSSLRIKSIKSVFYFMSVHSKVIWETPPPTHTHTPTLTPTPPTPTPNKQSKEKKD